MAGISSDHAGAFLTTPVRVDIDLVGLVWHTPPPRTPSYLVVSPGSVMSTRTVLVASLCGSLALVGCSGSDAPEAAKASVQQGAKQEKKKSDDPIAAVAYDFMDAVFANDIVRATQRLTPQAIQNMQAQDERFEWGAEAAKLEVGEVRVEGDEAVVACFVTEQELTEELLCMLRRVDGKWRVCGLACEGGADGEPQVVNFEETPKSPANQQRAVSEDRYVETPAPPIPGGNPPSVAEKTTRMMQ